MKRKHPMARSTTARTTKKSRDSNRVREQPVQYTVRNVPAKADQALRRRAAELDISLNEILRRAILREVGIAGETTRTHHDLDHLAGAWVDDSVFDDIIAEQDRIDEELWK